MTVVDEFSLIEKIIQPQAGRRDDVILGIGDDGALVLPPADAELVIVADTLVEGVHFLPSLPPADIGFRVAAVNLSDLAAMGADARWATLALTLPQADPDWLDAFMQGFHAACRPHAVQLVGGDTTRGPLTLTVQMIGAVPRGQALRRSGAQPGDGIYVSGTLGDAAAGLEILKRGGPVNADEAFLVNRFSRPTARLGLGQALRGIASSCIDISDGLLADLGHICAQSRCGAELDLSRLPLSSALRRVWGAPAGARLAATSGDDYELCLTVRANGEAEVGAVAPLTRVGTMRTEPGIVVRSHKAVIVFSQSGYRHF